MLNRQTAASIDSQRVLRWMNSPLFHGALIAVCIAVVLAPTLDGFWGRDDFGCLATVRMIGSPWILFTQDHYPVAHSVFRPMGYFVMWLCVKLFGISYAPHAAFDLALHVGVSLALWRLLTRNDVPHVLSTFCALIFALHPTVAGPVLWWSAKFDLLATLFTLVSLNAAFQFRDRQTLSALVATLSAGLAAMLSKEIGMIAVVGATLIWLHWLIRVPQYRRAALSAIALSWLSALVYMTWRWLVLGSFSSGITGSVPLHDAFVRGLTNWLTQAAGYFTFLPRLESAESVILVLCGGVLLTAFVVGLVASANKDRPRFKGVLILLGLCLIICPIIVQAPIAAFASPLNDGFSAIEAGMQSRLYYLEIAGATIIAAALLEPFWRVQEKIRYAFAAALTIIVPTVAWASHEDATAYSKRSVEISAVARSAVAAIQPLQLPPSQCHIVFLGYAPPPEWSIVVSMDSIVKALVPDIKKVKHCWIHSDVRTSFHLQAAPTAYEDAAPFTPAVIDGRVAPWHRAGKLVFAYLSKLNDSALRGNPNATFFMYRTDAFKDVTHDVAAGEFSFELK